jgi:hypothetical protein
MKTARLKEELVVPGYWYYFVNHDGENEACWVPPPTVIINVSH